MTENDWSKDHKILGPFVRVGYVLPLPPMTPECYTQLCELFNREYGVDLVAMAKVATLSEETDVEQPE